MHIPGDIVIQLEESLQVRSRYVLQDVHICTFGPFGPRWGVSCLDGRIDKIRHFLKLGVQRSSIAKITDVTRPTLYNFVAIRGLEAGP